MLQFRSERLQRVFVSIVIIGSFLAARECWAQQAKKGGRKKPVPTASASATASATPVSEVPLPIGHEAKGLVFPDFDENGQLRGRFTAGTARRVDENHMEFRDLNITTYAENNQVDLQVNMTESTLDLNTKVLSSNQPTRIKRTDFEITGDRARFDTAARHGTLSGHVKMIITDAAKFTQQQKEQ